MPTAYLCDFDGTVAPSDIGAALFRRFATRGTASATEALRRWKADEIGSRQLTEIECACIDASAEEALAFARGHAIDPEFAAFAHAAEGRGDRIMVVSEGYDFYVGDALARAGLEGLSWR